MNIRMRLLTILTCISTLAPTAPTAPTQISLLTDIRDAISDDFTPGDVATYPQTWGYANTLSGLTPSQADSGGLAKYWSGEHMYTDEVLSRIEVAQIVVDMLIAKGFQGSLQASDFVTMYTAITGSTLASNHQTIRAIQSITNTVPTELANLYVAAYKLKEQSKNCKVYWGCPTTSNSNVRLTALAGTATTPPTFPTSSSSGSSTGSGTGSGSGTSTTCNEIRCSVSSANSFNGYPEIISNLGTLNSSISTVCGTGTSASGSHGSEPACVFLRSLVARGLLDAPTGTLSEDEGKTFIETLNSNLDAILAPIQTLVLTQIDDIITANPNLAAMFPTTSFSSLYSQPSTATITSCTGTPGTAPIPNQVNLSRCYVGGSRTNAANRAPPNPGLDAYVDDLTGIAGVISPIIPGLPLPLANNQQIRLLIAGKYQILQRTNHTNGTTYWRSLPTTGTTSTVTGSGSDPNLIYIPRSEGDAARSVQERIRNDFYLKRNGFQAGIAKSLMAKSSALDVMNEIRNMNSVPQHYGVNGRLYSKTAMQILKESSQWRLKPSSTSGTGNPTDTDSWLHQVSRMSNVSLLRELAVLLAEMRQLQYLQLQTTQKQLLVQAITSSSSTDETDAAELSPLKTSVENYAAGVNASRPSAPSQATARNQLGGGTVPTGPVNTG